MSQVRRILKRRKDIAEGKTWHRSPAAGGRKKREGILKESRSMIEERVAEAGETMSGEEDEGTGGMMMWREEE